VGYPHRCLLNCSPFSVARTIVFYWHSTCRRDNRCCSLSTVCVRHFINFELLNLNMFCEDVGAPDLFTPKGILLVVNNESQHTYRPDFTYVSTLT
jgi:hypothetical protein